MHYVINKFGTGSEVDLIMEIDVVQQQGGMVLYRMDGSCTPK